MSSSLHGKRVLVTGASGGIGQAVVNTFVQRGATVCATDRENSEVGALYKTDDVRVLYGDLTSIDFSSTLAQAAKTELGGLDCVVNNAGIIHRGNVLQTRDEDWARTMQINLDAVFRVCRDSVGIMRGQDGGSIINVASCWGLYPGPDHIAYCTSKAAVAAFTKCLARDHAPDNIRVNAVAPNEVNTPMLRTGFEIRGLNVDTAIDTLNKSVPLGRIAEPQDIANTIAFLASDEATYLCGACIEINGAKPVV